MSPIQLQLLRFSAVFFNFLIKPAMRHGVAKMRECGNPNCGILQHDCGTVDTYGRERKRERDIERWGDGEMVREGESAYILATVRHDVIM